MSALRGRLRDAPLDDESVLMLGGMAADPNKNAMVLNRVQAMSPELVRATYQQTRRLWTEQRIPFEHMREMVLILAYPQRNSKAACIDRDDGGKR